MITNGKHVRRLAVVLGASALCASAAWGATTQASSPAQTSGEPDIDFRAPAIGWSDGELVERASLFSGSVPLPTGGNFNGIRWDELKTGTDTDIRFVLQYNAACQWLRAAAGRRDSDRQDAIWDELPRWPAMRLGGIGAQFMSSRSEALQGRGSALLDRCVESHLREVEFATAAGRHPSA